MQEKEGHRPRPNQVYYATPIFFYILFNCIHRLMKNATPFSKRLMPRIMRDTKAVPSIKDCDSNCGINSDNGVVLKFTKKETAEIVTIAFTKK